MRHPVLVLFFLWSMGLSGQIIDNSQCKAFTDEPFFNEEFIERNDIKSIHGTVQTKEKMDIIRDKDLEVRYEFNEDGRLTNMWESSYDANGNKDTSFMKFTYDDSGRLKIKRRNDSYGFYSYNYKYDSLGRIIEEKYCRDENVGTSKDSFELGNQYTIICEKYKYEPVSENEYLRIFYNNYGRPYQETRYIYDELGNLRREESKLLVTKKRNIVEYVFDDKGQIIQRCDTSSIGGGNVIVDKYSYDELGNLQRKDVIRNNKATKRREVVYFKDTMLIKAIIKRDMQTDYMMIIRFEYEFYE